jgi:cell division protein FtsI (penicillin-binding protein 3)
MSLKEDIKIETKQAKIPVIDDAITRRMKESDFKSVTRGYSVKIPPIYMIAYFNAVANNGKYVKPILVKSKTCTDKEKSALQVKVINPAICSPAVIAKAKDCLETVVTDGTGWRAQDDQYLVCIKNKDTNILCRPLIAGKTGSAFIYIEKERKYSKYLSPSHPSKDIKNSSFIGYFPSHKPKYTCLVLISGTNLDGGRIAAPVVKEIAEKLHLHDVEMELSKLSKNNQRIIPTVRFAYAKDVDIIYNELKIPLVLPNGSQYVGISKDGKNEVVITPIKTQWYTLSELRHASAKDAVYILEKAGYNLIIKGKGKVSDVQIN